MLKFKYLVVWVGILSFFVDGEAFAVRNQPSRPLVEARNNTTVVRRNPNSVERVPVRRSTPLLSQRNVPQLEGRTRSNSSPAPSVAKTQRVVIPPVRRDIRQNIAPTQTNTPRRAPVRVVPVARPTRVVPQRVQMSANRGVPLYWMVRQPISQMQPRKSPPPRALPYVRQANRAPLPTMQWSPTRGPVGRPIPQQQVTTLSSPRLTSRTMLPLSPQQPAAPAAPASRTYRLRFGDLPQDFKTDFIRALREEQCAIPEDNTLYAQEDDETLRNLLRLFRDHYEARTPGVTQRMLTHFRSLGFQG
jgi:hypothetical protein